MNNNNNNNNESIPNRDYVADDSQKPNERSSERRRENRFNNYKEKIKRSERPNVVFEPDKTLNWDEIRGLVDTYNDENVVTQNPPVVLVMVSEDMETLSYPSLERKLVQAGGYALVSNRAYIRQTKGKMVVKTPNNLIDFTEAIHEDNPLTLNTVKILLKRNSFITVDVPKPGDYTLPNMMDNIIRKRHQTKFAIKLPTLAELEIAKMQKNAKVSQTGYGKKEAKGIPLEVFSVLGALLSMEDSVVSRSVKQSTLRFFAKNFNYASCYKANFDLWKEEHKLTYIAMSKIEFTRFMTYNINIPITRRSAPLYEGIFTRDQIEANIQKTDERARKMGLGDWAIVEKKDILKKQKFRGVKPLREFSF